MAHHNTVRRYPPVDYYDVVAVGRWPGGGRGRPGQLRRRRGRPASRISPSA